MFIVPTLRQRLGTAAVIITLKHLPFFKWKEEDKTIQIQHVEDNKESMCISKGFRGLPDNKKHLLGDENGPTGERS